MSQEPAQPARAYNDERMLRLSAAMWAALIAELRDEAGVVTLPMGEVLDAVAMLGGFLLSTWPDGKVPSSLRARCTEVAKDMALRARQAMADPNVAAMFTVMPGSSEVQH